MRAWTLEVLLGILAVASSLLNVFKTWADPKASAVEYVAPAIIIALAFIFGIWKSLKSRAQELKYEPLVEPTLLRGWAKGLLAALQNLPLPMKPSVRITVHKVIWDKQRTRPVKLQQIINYVGENEGTLGRLTDARAGIIGRCCRTGTIQIAKRTQADPREFVKELVRAWGFQKDEASARTSDRWAWMAYPLVESVGGPVFAVVFVDTDSTPFVDNQLVQDTVYSHCVSLVSTCVETYSVL
jgi:hypothetical protein